MATTRRTYTAEFKQEAVRLVLERGMTRRQVAVDLGVHKTLIGSWVRDPAFSGAIAPEAVDMAEELRRLRRENAILREEREILKKAAAFFAKESR